MKLISVVATVSLLVLISACEKKAETPPQALEKASAEVKKPVAEVTELKIEDTKTGDGAVAEAGKRVTVHYTGWLTNGTKFDSSKDHGQPFTFQLGTGQVIKGWDQGV